MSFLNNFFHHPPSHPEYQGPPQPPPPWVAEWDGQSQRWVFVNQQTGQRDWNFPQAGPPQGYNQGGPPQGYNQGGYNQGGPPQGYNQGGPPQGYNQGGQGYGQGYNQGGPPQGYNQGGQGYGGQPQAAQKSHAGRNTAIAAVAGLAGGALLMHEGEKVEDDWRRDKDRLEDRVDYDKDRIEDRVDYDKDRVEGDFYNAGQDIENFPDDAAGWAGRKVGDVERFDDGIQDSYDDGRDEERYDNDDY